MVVINITQQHEFEELVSKTDLVVVHFCAEWATQCGPMNEVIEELAKQTEYKDVKFAKCPAEDLSEISLKYNITAVPTFLLLRNGKLLDRVDGADAAELTKKINEQVQKGFNDTSSPETEDLNTRLQKLINACPVMLFMKGSATEPRCGFSKSMVAILDRHDVEYKTYDILMDEEVRQGLKALSNWPTYPQLYINGELVGGLDIVKEMEGTGELKDMLPKKQPIEERLKLLVNKCERMVFMKGCRDVPKCGFSKQLMEILAQTGVHFETYDILRDDEVRQALKNFSNWPTYPQLYVKGELVGGLDIILQLKENGELLKALQIN